MQGVLRGLLLLGVLGSVTADPDGIVVHGASGKQIAANGIYFQTDVSYNGHKCFKKEHVKLWLCMDSNNLWNVQVEDMRGGSMGILVSTARRDPSPLHAGPWKVYVDASQSWVPDPKVNVVQFVPRMPNGGVLEPRHTTDTEDAKLRQAVATILFGALLLGMISMCLATSSDPHVRSYFFKLLSATLTFLMSFLVVQAIYDLLFQQLFPAPMPFGLGLGFPVKPGVKIVAGFALFTLIYLSLNFWAWKCQFRRARLYVLRTLGAHLAAIFGIFTFTTIQSEAVFSAFAQFQGPLLDSEAAKIFTAFLVAVVAWFTFWVYRSASIGVQKEVFKQPPVRPWPAPIEPPVSSGVQTRRPDSCSTYWGTQTPVLIAKKPGPNWGEFVCTAEDDAAVIVLGYLVNQTLTFCASGQLPGMKMVYTYNSAYMLKFWTMSVVAFLVVLLLVMCIRSRFGDGGRPGSILNRTLAMSLSWCVYRASAWASSGYLADNHPLMATQEAFVITILAIALMLLCDKILDRMLGRNSSPGLKFFMANFPDSEMSLLERGMRIMMTCTGMLVALAWEEAITFSVETTVLNSDILADHVVISKAVIFLTLAAFMFYPWRRIILPTSEMSEAHIEESIAHEQMQFRRAEDFLPIPQ